MGAGARAAATACWMSPGVTSSFLSATTPLALLPAMWLPAMPVYTELICTAAISSASSTAFLMDSTVLSMLTTTPLRRPRDGLDPTPTMSTPPSSVTWATTATTLVVPMSSPTTIWSRLATARHPLSAKDHLARILQVDFLALERLVGARADATRLLHLPVPIPLVFDRLGPEPEPPAVEVRDRMVGVRHVHLGTPLEGPGEHVRHPDAHPHGP